VTGPPGAPGSPRTAQDAPGLSDGQLAALLADVAAGRFPSPDGSVTILPQPSARDAGVISFTAHSVIFTDADPAWVRGQLTPDDLSAPLQPAFLQAISGRTGRRVNNIDLLCVAASLPGPPDIAVAAMSLGTGAPARLARALRYRDDVRGWEVPGGIVLLGRGVAGRWELAVEVEPEYRGQGLGRDLVTAARHLVPGGAPLWAQIAPGNAASVRAFLAAGYTPVGAEALLPLSRATLRR
jgi:GNAT superfamily N-acetyltransferase